MLVLPVERDRPDLHAFHRSAEVAGAGEPGRHRLVERPPPVWVAMPDRREACTDRGCGPPAQAEDVAGAEGQTHDAVAGHALACRRRKLRILLSLPRELGRAPHPEHHLRLTPSVAEDGRVIPGPLPHRGRADHFGVRDALRLAEITGVETDRTEPE